MLATVRPLRKTEKGPEGRRRQSDQEARGYELFKRMRPLAIDGPGRPSIVTPREVEDGNRLGNGDASRLWDREYIVERQEPGWRGERKTQRWLAADIVNLGGDAVARPIPSYGLTGDGMVLPPEHRHDRDKVDEILDTLESRVIAFEGIASLMRPQAAPQPAEAAQPAAA